MSFYDVLHRRRDTRGEFTGAPIPAEVLRRVLALPVGSPRSRARAMQAVSLVERPRACIVHPSAQCAAAARESLHAFELVGDRRRAAFSELLLAVEGISGGDHPDAGGRRERTPGRRHPSPCGGDGEQDGQHHGGQARREDGGRDGTGHRRWSTSSGASPT